MKLVKQLWSDVLMGLFGWTITWLLAKDLYVVYVIMSQGKVTVEVLNTQLTVKQVESLHVSGVICLIVFCVVTILFYTWFTIHVAKKARKIISGSSQSN